MWAFRNSTNGIRRLLAMSTSHMVNWQVGRMSNRVLLVGTFQSIRHEGSMSAIGTAGSGAGCGAGRYVGKVWGMGLGIRQAGGAPWWRAGSNGTGWGNTWGWLFNSPGYV